MDLPELINDVLARAAAGILSGIALAILALGVFALLFGGLGPISIAAMEIAFVVMCLVAIFVRSPYRIWGLASAFGAVVMLTIPVVDYSHTVVVDTAIKWDDRWYNLYIAGGSGTEFTSHLALVVALVLLAGAVLLYVASRR